MADKMTIDNILQDIDRLLKKKKQQKESVKSIIARIGIRNPLEDDFNQYAEKLTLLGDVNVDKVNVKSPRPVLGSVVTAIKRLIRKSTYWLYQPLFLQINEFNSVLIDTLRLLTHTIDTDLYDVDTKLEQLLSELQQRLDEYSGSFEGIKSNLTAYLDEMQILRRDFEASRAESALMRAKLALVMQELKNPSVTKNPSKVESIVNEVTSMESSYFHFEAQFRGSLDLVRERQTAYLQDIKKAYDSCGGFVLDMGCGRGEFLELCRDMGIEAKGNDLNEVMIEKCREKNLDVVYGDGLAYLRSLPNESLCAFTAFQVVEHIPFDLVWELLQLIILKLKPGGVIVLETINPDSLVPLKNFYVDPTHEKPIPSITLRFALEAAGFKNVDIRLSAPFDQRFLLTGDDENTRKLNDLLFGYSDYAVVGWK